LSDSPPGFIKLIKEAILKPLAKLAEGTPAWDLLLQVLGENPITGEKVPQSADALIGGFMKMIGQEEIWNNIKKANAISRRVSGVQGRARGPARLRACRAGDVPRRAAVARDHGHRRPAARVHQGRQGVPRHRRQVLSWALQQVLSLLQIIFESSRPVPFRTSRRPRARFNEILRAPGKFIGNLVRAGKQGFDNFRKNFLATCASRSSAGGM